LILILPSLFGLTLVGDGINKMVQNQKGGLLSLIFGILFIGVVIFAYLFFASYLGKLS